MVAASSYSSSGRGWRRSRRADEGAGKKARTIGRAVFTILALALVALLIWWLWWLFFSRQTHLACLTVEEYRPTSIRPIAYAEEDSRAISFPSPLGDEPVRSLHSLQTSASLQTLAAQLDARRDDVLVLYVSAQGVSHDGTAYLLGANFLDQPASGRIKLAEVLAETARLGGKLKLLVLNVSHVSSDPRLGMLVNEFPRLLVEAVEETQDPSLWVLAACRPLQTSRASHSRQLSAFAFYVSEGLRGAADRDLNRKVSLDELADYVGVGVANWVDRTSGGQTAQSPLLLRGGKGIVPTSEGEGIVVLVPALFPQEDEEADETEGKKAAQEEKGLAQAQRKKIEDLLARAWRRRDQMLRREKSSEEKTPPGDGWAEVDFAPHLCREFQARLLAYDEQSRCGRAFRKKLPGELDGLLHDRGPSTILGRLADARKRFDRAARPDFRRAAGEYAAYFEALRLKNDLLFRAPSYVRWHAAAVMNSKARNQRHSSFQPIFNLLAGLAKLIGQIEPFEQTYLRGDSVAAGLSEDLTRLRDSARLLADIHKNLQQNVVRQRAGELAARPDAKGNAARIDNLLSTAVLPADYRLQLIRALDKLQEPLDAEVPPDEYHPPVARVPWALLRDQARLEAMLVGLADPKQAATMDEIIATLPAHTSQKTSRNRKGPWRLYQDLGNRLGTFHAELPRRVERACKEPDRKDTAPTPTDFAQRQALGRLLRAVDGRDVEKLDDSVCRFALIPMPVALAPAVLTIDGPGTLMLDRDEPRRLDLSIGLPGQTSRDVSVRLQFNSEELAIRRRGQRQPLRSGRWMETSPDSQGRLSLTIQPADGIDGADGAEFETAPLVVEVKAGRQSGKHAIRAMLPPPDKIEAVVGQVANRGRLAPIGYHLRPFPNRDTEFKLGLKNSSPRAKNVTVQLLAAPKTPAGARQSRAWPLDDSGRARGGFTPLTEPVKIALPADDTVRPIPFAEESGKDKAEAKDAAEHEPPAVDVTAGIVITIVDGANHRRRWSQWLRFTPRAPGDYVRSTVAYDRARRRLDIDLAVRDTPLLPQLPPDGKPIRVVWPTLIETQMRDRAQLISSADTAQLFATIEPGPKTVVPVMLDIDGYPRAFIYDVLCDQSHTADRITNRADIRITAPRPDTPFPASQTAIPVSFRVDAPTDAFQRIGAAASADTVQAWIDANGNGLLDPVERETAQTFKNDRQVTVRLLKLRLGGRMAIRADVADFDIKLSTGGLKNKRVDVAARLLLPGRGPTQDRVIATVPIILDGLPPVFRDLRMGDGVEQGKKLLIAADVVDLGGVASVEAAFDLNDSQSLDKADKPKQLRLAADGLWNVALGTKDLEPGLYMVVVRATDRVNNTKTATARVKVIRPPDKTKPKTPPPPATGTITGRVFLGDQNCSGMAVRLVETGQTATTDSTGRFQFDNIPAGPYQLTVTGPWKNMIRKGKAKVTLKAGKTATAEIPLK